MCARARARSRVRVARSRLSGDKTKEAVRPAMKPDSVYNSQPR